ncbi:hypothetical protein GRAN_2242 [Granulicella sibirica]|uniref:Uncharacterized protein n=1 Tax=Granulicella sibirica TaxID=2479048 RepID=A0A4Q0T796_9BACT|nr:hypothetical protein GRAN_2242 [Granulicella sibirica]
MGRDRGSWPQTAAQRGGGRCGSGVLRLRWLRAAWGWHGHGHSNSATGVQHVLPRTLLTH